jgi:HEAT repeat protein
VEPIVEVASDLLVFGQVEVLRVAASTLVEIGPDAAAALPRLHDCLDASSLAARLYAAEATLRIDPTDELAVETLHAALDSHETEVRFFSVNALGAAVRVNDGAVFAVLRALSDPDPKVATAAAVHLSRTPNADQQTLPGVQAIDPDDSESMPAEVAEWISDLSDAAADVRQAAAIRLAIAGPAACHAVEALTTALGDPDPIVRLHVALAIWEIGRNGYPIYPVLVDLLLTNDTDTRIGAAYALGRIGPAARDTLPWLTKLLNETKTIDRLPLAVSIVQIDPARPGVLDILVGGLRVPDADVRYLSTVALGAAPLSRQAAVEQTVRLAAADRNFHVRCAACESLNQLQERRAAVRVKHPATRDTDVRAAATGTSSR